MIKKQSPIALIHRVEKTDSKQYPFYDVESIRKFSTHAKHRQEILKINLVNEQGFISSEICYLGKEYDKAVHKKLIRHVHINKCREILNAGCIITHQPKTLNQIGA